MSRGKAASNGSPRMGSRQCAPRWDDDTVVATMDHQAPSLKAASSESVPETHAPSRERTWNVGDPVKTNQVFSYVVVHDTGFSPNPFHGFLTLACCKPQIRKTAGVGDIIVGMSSRSERIIYATQVAEAISFDEYWADPRFLDRRPIMNSPEIVFRAGDNIYEPIAGGHRQLPSFHSNPDGSEDAGLKQTDLSANRVLVGERFTYWGRSGPALPEELLFLAVGRGHRCKFTPDQVDTVARWFANLPGGVLGAPTHWKAGDQSWSQS